LTVYDYAGLKTPFLRKIDETTFSENEGTIFEESGIIVTHTLIIEFNF
jgi:hypothetical protein